jgi:hypothetical protein
MADTAILIGGRMIGRRVFTYGEDTIMTRRAVIDDTHMVKGCGYEASGLMALFASIVGRHMVGGFSYGRITVMTRNTAIDDALVIKLGTGKGRGVMAHLAILSCRNVSRISLGGLADRFGSIMTDLADSISGQAIVVEYRWCKSAARCVTNAAILACRYVSPNRLVLLTGRRITIMTGLA